MEKRLAGSLELARNVELVVSKRATTTLVAIDLTKRGYKLTVAQKLLDDFKYSEVVEMVGAQLDAAAEDGYDLRAC